MVSEEAKAAVAAEEAKDVRLFENSVLWCAFINAIQLELTIAALRNPQPPVLEFVPATNNVMIGTCLAMELDTKCLNTNPRLLMMQCKEFVAWITEGKLTAESRPAWVVFK